MDISEYLNSMSALIDDLNSNRERETIIIAQESAALVRGRVQNDKLDHNGSSFGAYSSALVPKWMLEGKSLSDGAEQTIDDGDWFQSYLDLREANNLPTDSKDFTFSGSMWKNIGAIGVENGRNSTTVYVGGQTDRAADILRWQEPRSGNIIQLSKEEIDFIRDAHLERINKELGKYFS